MLQRVISRIADVCGSAAAASQTPTAGDILTVDHTKAIKYQEFTVKLFQKMDGNVALHFANFSTLFVCMVLKFPQIFVLMRAKSSTGVSLNSLLLELIGFIVFMSYQMYNDYPPVTYLEYPILVAQGGWQLLTVQKWVIDLAMSLCTFISAGSKLAQLQCLWRSKDSRQVSSLTWGLATYTCLARIFTTTITTGDTQVLIRFVVMSMLNMWVTVTVIYYKPRAVKQD
ncbi:PQ-loop repeat-containing protein 3 [Triplophysa tibetana]|uniref:PQ-loop repeat-containing protein 3 n=1 Tax=Triplophysa tibetana TaxID=1572043 RepID=A0A5A9P842_9TELE|nr:PQ-loop repeat-containing protein 3 [Triplophysa tibetana]